MFKNEKNKKRFDGQCDGYQYQTTWKNIMKSQSP